MWRALVIGPPWRSVQCASSIPAMFVRMKQRRFASQRWTMVRSLEGEPCPAGAGGSDRACMICGVCLRCKCMWLCQSQCTLTERVPRSAAGCCAQCWNARAPSRSTIPQLAMSLGGSQSGGCVCRWLFCWALPRGCHCHSSDSGFSLDRDFARSHARTMARWMGMGMRMLRVEIAVNPGADARPPRPSSFSTGQTVAGEGFVRTRTTVPEGRGATVGAQLRRVSEEGAHHRSKQRATGRSLGRTPKLSARVDGRTARQERHGIDRRTQW